MKREREERHRLCISFSASYLTFYRHLTSKKYVSPVIIVYGLMLTLISTNDCNWQYSLNRSLNSEHKIIHLLLFAKSSTSRYSSSTYSFASIYMPHSLTPPHLLTTHSFVFPPAHHSPIHFPNRPNAAIPLTRAPHTKPINQPHALLLTPNHPNPLHPNNGEVSNPFHLPNHALQLSTQTRLRAMPSPPSHSNPPPLNAPSPPSQPLLGSLAFSTLPKFLFLFCHLIIFSRFIAYFLKAIKSEPINLKHPPLRFGS